MKKFHDVALVIGIAISALPANAQHSFSTTITEEEIVVEGCVESMRFIYPHAMVYFNVTDENGREQPWLAEADSATSMGGQDLDRDRLSESDSIRVR